jgi:hypothetical protein
MLIVRFTCGRMGYSRQFVFAVAFGLYDVDSSGLIDKSEFSDMARNMLVAQANGVRAICCYSRSTELHTTGHVAVAQGAARFRSSAHPLLRKFRFRYPCRNVN